jgi:eukaryotic-like serine/threonine-protein kinase
MTQGKKRVLSNRYEIDAVLGQGGMAKVFKGSDRVLSRTVAVKVLSPQFAGDDQFVSRFRREAQAAAGLNHPNIVSVFDTGDQGDVHYIVMEYVEGRTLRDAIRQGGPLLPERAVEITEEVARALGAAHEAGLVHRDVKPGNIMLTSDGSEVKVMDFGIARTTSGDTLTQTAAVLGTASYLSPEQAQGQSVDARTDIYSLGCVLYEMLTGRPPFTGDSPVSIAYKHVKEDPVPPTSLNDDVTPGLEAVVMKMLAKNAANRYQTAHELLEDLERVRQGLPTLATPVLPGDTTEMLTRQEADRTAVMTGAPPEEEEGRRSRTWLAVLGVLLALGLLGLAAFFLVRALLPEEAAAVAVPDVVGQSREDAEQLLERRGFDVDVQTEFNDEAPRGEVFRQDPEAGTEVEEGSEVTIFVSRGQQQVEVPSLEGLTVDEAGQALADEGLQLGDVIDQESEAEEGTIIGQDPAAGEQVDPDTSVDVTVSSGPGTVIVPGVICQGLDEAEAAIEGAGLQFDVIGQAFSLECEPGTVATQNPAGGEQAEPDSTVRVRESLGPSPEPTVTVTESP